MTTPSDKPTIRFDGFCNLCNASVQESVIKYDPHKKFKLGSLQSNQGKALMQTHALDELDMSSFILIKDNMVYTRSSAALKVVKEMSGLWPLLYAFMIVPKPIRDAVYTVIAKNRYRWFGKKEFCMVPDENVKDRFIE